MTFYIQRPGTTIEQRCTCDTPQAHLRGTLKFPAIEEPFPILQVQLLDDGGRQLAASFTSTEGAFVIPVASEAVHAKAKAIIVDGTGRQVAGSDVTFLVDSITIEVEGKSFESTHRPTDISSLVNSPRLAALEASLQEACATGRMEPQALETLAAATRPLLWLEALLADAPLVIQGCASAADRWRASLESLPLYAFERGTMFWVPQSAMLHEEAVVALVAATIGAARSQAEEEWLLHRLTLTLGSVRLLDLIVSGDVTNPASVRSLLLSPFPQGLPDWDDTGDVPGLNPKLPSRPTKKDWTFGLFPKDGLALLPTHHPTFYDPPTVLLNCFDIGRQRMATLTRSRPGYSITAFTLPQACPGETFAILGTGFGADPGQVLFPSADGGQAQAKVKQWSDTLILVTLPANATAGVVTLKIFIGFIEFCGVIMPVYRSALTSVPFGGGVAAILSFSANGSSGNCDVEPGGLLTFAVNLSKGAFSISQLNVVAPDGSAIFTAELSAGPQIVTMTAPSTTTQLVLTAKVVVENSCGLATERDIPIRVRRHPNVRICGVEVVQAIQKFDFDGIQNTVAYCARRRTIARVYIDSGLSDGFDYGAGPNQLPGMSGVVTLYSNGNPVATVTPCNADVSARPVDTMDRGTTDHSLNFSLPAALLSGKITLRVSVQAEGDTMTIDPSGSARYGSITNCPPLQFDECKTRSIVCMYVRDALHNLPAPTQADYLQALDQTRSCYPVAADGFELRVSPGFTNIKTTRDLNTQDGWNDLLDDIGDHADDDPDHAHIWAAMVPTSGSYPVGGKTHRSRTATIGSLELYWRAACLAVQKGPGVNLAHELGHALNLDHSPCVDSSASLQLIDVNKLAPGRTEDFGMDAYADPPAVVRKGIGELMSYCDRPYGWTSIYNWHWLSVA